MTGLGPVEPDFPPAPTPLTPPPTTPSGANSPACRTVGPHRPSTTAGPSRRSPPPWRRPPPPPRRADLPALATRTTPSPPLTVKAGRPRRLAARISVPDCRALPHGVNIPRLDLILRTPQAQQPYSFLVGGNRPRTLSRLPHTACPPQGSNTV
ncbi:hypothetical protein SAV31267_027990 [Streptomyces avermitilis]|uniref:Uncharacterized protein n=1 Tax=Streptomyces avermitilis TaxID=33903 RepID=A0A4D4MNM2_STRAX|nr:hypothetical protein SAVMC3_70790 [Streptomyces avermitilis]GDY73314.1 hypothetical protein SAV31267_027990 [Streptomyces avermitilis]